ncbi:hypothetical protein D6R50_18590 [Aeromonas veronii]|uniref:Uncharacterized protein n=2 Tax=Pseudomonadota TaxID=1224 RepID=A0A3A9ID65_AERVE|nr:hypothetical protein AL543_09340 [Vibrio mimicus]RKJ86291.1 hypothetical protein D6R50_18590 [Aeromonas veronii]
MAHHEFQIAECSAFSCSNGFRLLAHAGNMSRTQIERATTTRYLDYDQRSKEQETHQADAKDKTEQQTLETTLKKQPKP